MGLFLPQPPPPDSDEEDDDEGAAAQRSHASIPMDEGKCVLASQLTTVIRWVLYYWFTITIEVN